MRNVAYAVLSAVFFLTACQSTQNIRTASPLAKVLPETPLTVMSYNIRLGIGSQYESGKEG